MNIKTIHRLLFILITACFTSCQEVSVSNNAVKKAAHSVKKNLQTGLKTSAEGLSFEDHYLVNDKNEELVLTDFQRGNIIVVVLTGVRNFTVVNERVYPGVSLTVTDTTGKVVMETGDLFNSYADGFSEKDASTLRASLTIGSPLTEGNYRLNARFWDTKGKGLINSTLDFAVVPGDQYD